MRGSERENNMNSARFDHRRKGLVVIDPLGLRKPTDYPTRLITSECTVRVVFVPKKIISR